MFFMVAVTLGVPHPSGHWPWLARGCVLTF